MPLPAWSELDLPALLTLEAAGPGRWHSRFGDANRNGRSYGGQLLGQAMMAGLLESPADRAPTMMQFLFLQGAVPEEAIFFDVTRLQDGKRFSSRHVRGSQSGGRMVLDAQVTCALALDAPEHETLCAAPAGEQPEDLPGLGELPPGLLAEVTRLGGYSNDRKPSVDFRIPDAQAQLGERSAEARLRYWMKIAPALPDDARMHAAAFAYLSDWWVNFSSLGLHLRDIGDHKLYIASLNHAIWLHRGLRADQWMHVETTSPCGASGRGLSIARIHDQAGRLVASATQECLMAYA